MKKTTPAWLALVGLFYLAVSLPGAHGQCPVGATRVVTQFSCNQVGYDLQRAVTSGTVERFEWRAREAVASVTGESLTWQTGRFLTDALTNTSNVLQTVVYEVVPVGAGECRGSLFEIIVNVGARVEATGCFACNDTINLTFSTDCRAVLTLEEAAEGEEGSACPNRERLLEAVYVAVYDGVYPGNDPERADGVIEKTGTFTFEVRLRPEYSDCFIWVPCWGAVVVEDKSPPEATCPVDVIGLVKTATSATQGEALIDGIYYRYRPGTAADVNCPATATCDDGCSPPLNGFNYLICTDIDSVLRVARSWQDETYPYFLGAPTAVDCNGAVLVDVRDVLFETDCGALFRYGRQVEARIERTFTYRDPSGNTTSCTQIIYFFRPDIELPSCTVTLDLCKYPGISTANASSLLNPLATGTAPFYFNGMCRRIPLLDHACRFTVEYSDQALPGPEGCGIKVIRRWTFLDWCWTADRICEDFRVPLGCENALSPWSNKKRVYEQQLVVADQTKPKVSCPNLPVFSTGPFNCTAVVAPPPPIVRDECSSWTWEFELYGEVIDPKTGIKRPNQLIATSINQVAAGIAPGNYDMHYLVRDACGNATRHICPIRVTDQINPVAICNADLKISIGGANTTANGIARIGAAEVDEGSYDNCRLTGLHVRRQIKTACVATYSDLVLNLSFPSGFTKKNDPQRPGVVFYLAGKDTLLVDEQGTFYSWWADVLYFTCCDVSTGPTDKITIDLRATDAAGNSNRCWLRVLIEDKLPPSCEVANAVITCTELDFDPRDPAQVAKRFGTAAQVVKINDNCGASVSESVRWLPGNCGRGLIERTFTVTDASGLRSQCVQRITVEEVNAYSVRFPRDLNSTQCGVEPSDSLRQSSTGCDILAINRDTARYAATDEECFKLLITYKVINWCEYDGESTKPTVIPRDIDEDGDLLEYTWLEAGLDSVFAKRYLPGEAQFYLVKLFAADNQGNKKALPERVLVRASCLNSDVQVGYRIWRHLGNGVYQEVCRKEVANICANQLYESQCWTPGFYSYTQILKVYDNTPPTITVITNDFDFCAYGDPARSCDASVDVAVTIEDNCTLVATEVRRVELLLDRDPNKVYGPDDGLFKVMTVGNTHVIMAQLPVGQHTFVIQAADGCGNQAGRRIDVAVRDCKAPSPICINGLGVQLMPVDTNGDGVIDGGMNTVRAIDLIASPVQDCSGQVTYSINRIDETPDRNKTLITFTCADPLFETIPIEVHAWDPVGNHNFCETFIAVQDVRGLCRPIGNGSISGLVLTEEDEPVEKVDMALSGQRSATTETGQDGAYVFRPLQEGYDYSLTPSRDGDYLNGVSTFDLVLISKHILNVKPLTSPYKMIAADANKSGSITTLDLIVLRKVILNVETRFANVPSWRFVPANYTFPYPSNPFRAAFPEVLNVNNLTGNYRLGDFVAIKVGDVNSSAAPNNLTGVEVRSPEGVLPVTAEAGDLEAGRTYVVPLTAAGLATIEGLQFTLQIDPAAAELTTVGEGLLRQGDWAEFPDRGIVTASWVNLLSADAVDGPLFFLTLRAKRNARLRDVLTIAGRPTRPEAYDREGHLLEVTFQLADTQPPPSSLALQQNHPNPFRETTTIGFTLPMEGSATLSIHNVEGKMLRQISGNYPAGRHQLMLDRHDLPAGVLYYSLESGGKRITRSMVAVN